MLISAFLMFSIVCLSATKKNNVQPQHLNPFGNALVPDMIADASIQQINGTFYCFATIDGYGRGLETSGPPTVWKSEDFVNWQFEGIYFPSAKEQVYWAPSKVVPYKDKYYIFPTINGYMYPSVAENPDGPFRVVKGEDKFERPFTNSTLLMEGDRYGIDAEIFIDDDGQRYIFWSKRHVAKLSEDMAHLASEPIELPSPHDTYSEGPIFFKRNGIYYYLYTLEGHEKYQYAYMYSKVSPMGPYEVPEKDIITCTNKSTGVYGPGHGSVFCVEGTDDWYFAFLEFGRRSTNRQTYVNKMEFNADGTIKPVEVSLEGVGALKKVKTRKALPITAVKASSVCEPQDIEPIWDQTFDRTEYFDAEFAVDGANGSRWMAKENDQLAWFTIDLGKVRKVKNSHLCFVRPTAGHSYVMETSNDGNTWKVLAVHQENTAKSPHTDKVNTRCRYLRVRITEGVAGIWEWKVD